MSSSFSFQTKEQGWSNFSLSNKNQKKQFLIFEIFIFKFWVWKFWFQLSKIFSTSILDFWFLDFENLDFEILDFEILNFGFWNFGFLVFEILKSKVLDFKILVSSFEKFCFQKNFGSKICFWLLKVFGSKKFREGKQINIAANNLFMRCNSHHFQEDKTRVLDFVVFLILLWLSLRVRWQ